MEAQTYKKYFLISHHFSSTQTNILCSPHRLYPVIHSGAEDCLSGVALADDRQGACVSVWGHLEGVLHGLWVLQLHHVQDVVGDVAGLPTSVPQLPPLLVILYHLEHEH